MSRYIERAENIARFIDVHLQLSLGDSNAAQQSWQPLIAVTGDEDHFAELYENHSRSSVMRYLTLDRRYPNSIASCIASARENARTIRETVTSEMWEQINALHIMVSDTGDDAIKEDRPLEFYGAVKNASLLFNGIAEATMSRGVGWDFCQLGRMIERADKTSRILDVKYFLLLPSADDVGSAMDIVQWSALLRSASALEMYRQKFGVITPNNVAQFLLLDASFPRSMTYCMLQAELSLADIEGGKGSCSSEAYRQVGRLRSELQFGDINEIIFRGMHEYLDQFQSKLNKVHEAIHGRFFEFLPPDPNPFTQGPGESPQ